MGRSAHLRGPRVTIGKTARTAASVSAGCCSGSSSTTTSAAPPTWSATSDAGEAVVVDPAYAIEQYLDEAERHGVRIVRVLETHTHADHVSGHGRLALEHGVPVSIHRGAEPEYPNEPLADGDEIARRRRSRSACIHTPGHRPEHCCFARRPPRRRALARPDRRLALRRRRRAARPRGRGARGRRGPLPQPAPAARAPRRRRGLSRATSRARSAAPAMSSKASSTIGFERRFNRAARDRDGDEFVDETAAARAPRPPNMERIVELNRGPFVGAPPPARAPRRAGRRDRARRARPPTRFAAGHVPGAINVPVSGTSFATKAGVRAAARRADRPPCRVDATRRSGAARRCARSASSSSEGYVSTPPAREHARPVDDRRARAAARSRRGRRDRRARARRARRGLHPGQPHIPYRLAARGAARRLADAKPVVTICESGPRAAIAASVLAARGVDARPVLNGGVTDWSRAAGRRSSSAAAALARARSGCPGSSGRRSGGSSAGTRAGRRRPARSARGRSDTS